MTKSKGIRGPWWAWSSEMDELLREKWGTRGNSAETIADTILMKFQRAVTRSAIIGRAHRLGLRNLKRRGRPKRKHRKTFRFKLAAPAPISPLAGLPPEAGGPHSCSILEVTGCRYPVANGLFCNEPGVPWCERHERVVFRLQTVQGAPDVAPDQADTSAVSNRNDP